MASLTGQSNSGPGPGYGSDAAPTTPLEQSKESQKNDQENLKYPMPYDPVEVDKYAQSQLIQTLNDLDLPIDLDKYRVEVVENMDSSKLGREKHRVKNKLKEYDDNFKRRYGKLPNRNEKEAMRPLYTLYRVLKMLLDYKSKHGDSEPIKKSQVTSSQSQQSSVVNNQTTTGTQQQPVGTASGTSPGPSTRNTGVVKANSPGNLNSQGQITGTRSQNVLDDPRIFDSASAYTAAETPGYNFGEPSSQHRGMTSSSHNNNNNNNNMQQYQSNTLNSNSDRVFDNRYPHRTVQPVQQQNHNVHNNNTTGIQSNQFHDPHLEQMAQKLSEMDINSNKNGLSGGHGTSTFNNQRTSTRTAVNNPGSVSGAGANHVSQQIQRQSNNNESETSNVKQHYSQYSQNQNQAQHQQQQLQSQPRHSDQESLQQQQQSQQQRNRIDINHNQNQNQHLMQQANLSQNQQLYSNQSQGPGQSYHQQHGLSNVQQPHHGDAHLNHKQTTNSQGQTRSDRNYNSQQQQYGQSLQQGQNLSHGPPGTHNQNGQNRNHYHNQNFQSQNSSNTHQHNLSRADDSIITDGNDINKLIERREQLQEQKSIIRDKLQKYQDEFLAKHNRKIRFHKDILPIERDYKNYKKVKDDISRVENEIAALQGSGP